MEVGFELASVDSGCQLQYAAADGVFLVQSASVFTLSHPLYASIFITIYGIHALLTKWLEHRKGQLSGKIYYSVRVDAVADILINIMNRLSSYQLKEVNLVNSGD